MSGVNSKTLNSTMPLPGVSVLTKDPVQLLKDLDNRPRPSHIAENAEQAARDKAADDAANNVTGNTPRTAQFATRAQIDSARAAAAGAQRSGNEADMLGYTSNTKKRGVARQILG